MPSGIQTQPPFLVLEAAGSQGVHFLAFCFVGLRHFKDRVLEEGNVNYSCICRNVSISL